MSTSSRKKIQIILELGELGVSSLSKYSIIDIKSLLRKDIVQTISICGYYELTSKGLRLYKHILSLVELM